MIPYDATFNPPAPILQVTLANVLNRRWRVTLPALLDSGADITAVPLSTAKSNSLSAASPTASSISSRHSSL